MKGRQRHPQVAEEKPRARPTPHDAEGPSRERRTRGKENRETNRHQN